jgi:hypothetical protein
MEIWVSVICIVIGLLQAILGFNIISHKAYIYTLLHLFISIAGVWYYKWKFKKWYENSCMRPFSFISIGSILYNE